MWLLTLIGCLPDTLPERSCDERVVLYPDADGDGLGEPTDLYVGCDAPAGWVSELAPVDTADTGSVGHTATGPPTADTGTIDHSGGGSGT